MDGAGGACLVLLADAFALAPTLAKADATADADQPVLIGLSVTVIVLFVTAFILGSDLALACPPGAVGTGLRSAFAGADTEGPGRTAVAGACQTFIDVSVAVVVTTVAGLRGG